MDRSELLDLIPAYALEALEPDEKRQVEALLKTDAEARKISAEYQVITTNLILATPARRAPAHLQNDLRQRLAANRSQGQVAPSASARPARRRVSIWVPLLAAAAVIAIIFGVIAYLNRNPAEDLYNKIKSMPGYKTMPIPSSDPNAPAGEMVASPDGTQAVIRMIKMPTLQADRTFQLWLINDNGPQSGGLFSFKQPDTTYYVVVPLDSKNVLDYKAYGVSVEPSGGSKTPSTTPIVVISTS